MKTYRFFVRLNFVLWTAVLFLVIYLSTGSLLLAGSMCLLAALAVKIYIYLSGRIKRKNIFHTAFKFYPHFWGKPTKRQQKTVNFYLHALEEELKALSDGSGVFASKRDYKNYESVAVSLVALVKLAMAFDFQVEVLGSEGRRVLEVFEDQTLPRKIRLVEEINYAG